MKIDTVKIFFIFLMILTCAKVQAFQDCVITTDAKLTDIKIENHNIIDVCPLITIMNEKNTLIVHPLSVGQTRFCVLKNNKNIEVFNVKVEEDKTIIDEVEGFLIDTLDEPPEFFDYDLDIPPVVNSSEGKING